MSKLSALGWDVKSTYHIGIQSSHELASSSRQLVNLIKTIVEVTSLEMMGLTRNLDSGHVVQVGVCHGQLVTLVFETGRLSIIQNDNSVSIAGIVQITCRTHSVHDQIIILTAAGDKGIDSGDVVSCHSQLGALPLLHRHRSPHVVHQRGNGDGNLNGDKHPRSLVRLPRCVLGPDNTGNSQSEICHVQTRVGKSE